MVPGDSTRQGLFLEKGRLSGPRAETVFHELGRGKICHVIFNVSSKRPVYSSRCLLCRIWRSQGLWRREPGALEKGARGLQGQGLGSLKDLPNWLDENMLEVTQPSLPGTEAAAGCMQRGSRWEGQGRVRRVIFWVEDEHQACRVGQGVVWERQPFPGPFHRGSVGLTKSLFSSIVPGTL